MPTGVYAYWDVNTHELLYLGLATDLIGRFAQHNGLVKHSGGNKGREIDSHFASHELLGITVLVQSKAIAILEQVQQISLLLGATASGLVATGEGQLIEIHRLVHGHRPRWNKTGGARDGKRWATQASGLLDVLALRRDSLFTARAPLRTVADDLRVRFFEARSTPLGCARSWGDARLRPIDPRRGRPGAHPPLDHAPRRTSRRRSRRDRSGDTRLARAPRGARLPRARSTGDAGQGGRALRGLLTLRPQALRLPRPEPWRRDRSTFPPTRSPPAPSSRRAIWTVRLCCQRAPARLTADSTAGARDLSAASGRLRR